MAFPQTTDAEYLAALVNSCRPYFDTEDEFYDPLTGPEMMAQIIHSHMKLTHATTGGSSLTSQWLFARDNNLL